MIAEITFFILAVLLVVILIVKFSKISSAKERSRKDQIRLRDINLKINNLTRTQREIKALGFGTVPEISIYARIIVLLEEADSIKGSSEIDKELVLMRRRIAELSTNFQKSKLHQFKEPLQLANLEKRITLVKHRISEAFAKGFVDMSQFKAEMDHLEDSKVTIRAFLMISLTKKLFLANAFNAEIQANKTKSFIEMSDFLRKELFLSSINKILNQIENRRLLQEQARLKAIEIHDPLANFERTLKSKDHL